MKRWEIKHKPKERSENLKPSDIVDTLLANRGLKTKKDKDLFLDPPDPYELKPADVDIDPKALEATLARVEQAMKKKESIVVYADYDADGISAGAILWEALHAVGGNAMPYIPHRVEEGYGMSKIGIDRVKEELDASLIITVDQGITGWEMVEYGKEKGIDVIVTDHHTKPKKLPDCVIFHTTVLAGAGVSWFLAKEILAAHNALDDHQKTELVGLAAIGAIADMMPLVGPNRSIVKYGLDALRRTRRIGLMALMEEAGIDQASLAPYHVSHMIGPRINAMGRLDHGMEALRLICTKDEGRATVLAAKLSETNKKRQDITMEAITHAALQVDADREGVARKNILVIADPSYNQGVIGLVAGRLMERFYRPAIVLAVGDTHAKASARSIPGFNIVEAIRAHEDLLVDVGGHPMAAGFTIARDNLDEFQRRLEEDAAASLTPDDLKPILDVDMELPLDVVTDELWHALEAFQPFGVGNREPVFVTRDIRVTDARLVGKDQNHLKLVVEAMSPTKTSPIMDAIGFRLGSYYGDMNGETPIDIAYTVDMNEWNGNRKLQLKLKDIQVQE